MTDYDFFDLTHLPFDPPEKAAQKILDAIEKAKKELDGSFNNGPRGDKEEVLFSEQKKCLASVLDANKEPLFDELERLANAHTDREIKKFRKTAAALKAGGTSRITKGTVRTYKQITKLSESHIEEVFSALGLEMLEFNYYKIIESLLPTNWKNHIKDLENLRNYKKNVADTSQVTDLYAFLAYMADEPENVYEYRNKSTTELKSLCEKYAADFGDPKANEWRHLCGSLATYGRFNVFDSEKKRSAYGILLKYKSTDLAELIDSLKGFDKSHLLNPRYAEKYVKQIFDIFGDNTIAVAVYNNELKLLDDPYIPVTPMFHVKCPHCQAPIEFTDAAEAQNINKCSNCGKPLYKRCGKCQKMALVSLDRCPECGFVFASAAMFAKYFAAAEQALRKSDFELARSSLYQAQAADPGEKSRTDELAARISAEEKRYEKPVNDLRKLLADKMFQKASETLAVITGSFPGLNVSVFEAQINTALSQARTRFANVGKLSSSGKADECVAILRDCVDFEPAVSFLQSTPPESCKNLSVGMDSLAGAANIGWTPSPEQGVSCRLVRKQGKEIPVSKMDGEILLDNTKDTTYRDKTILPGQWYSYAVFAVRYGVFSSAAGKTDVLLADVTDARAEQVNMTVRLTWNAPKNSAGVTIRRTQGGKETLLSSEAHGSFEDTNVQYGLAYAYKLCANYANLPHSRGVDIVITPMLKIESFAIAVKKLKENTYNVSWDINRRGIDLRILVGGKQVRELKSDAGSCDIELPANNFHTITVLAYSGGNWLPSKNSQEVNTYSPCLIDKASSSLHEDAIAGLREAAYTIELHLKIGVIPPNVTGFYYSVRTSASQNHWPTAQDIGTAQDIHRIGLAAYRENGEILYRETARAEASYYVSLFTIYNFGGKEIVSDPKPCRFDRPLRVDVFWKLSKSLLGDIKLSIEAAGNRPFSQAPRFVLCACADDQHLISHNDPKAVQVLAIQGGELETPRKTCNSSYDVRTDLSLRQLKNTKFFLFETAPVPGEEFILRWAKGFTGKI